MSTQKNSWVLCGTFISWHVAQPLKKNFLNLYLVTWGNFYLSSLQDAEKCTINCGSISVRDTDRNLHRYIHLHLSLWAWKNIEEYNTSASKATWEEEKQMVQMERQTGRKERKYENRRKVRRGVKRKKLLFQIRTIFVKVITRVWTGKTYLHINLFYTSC